MSIKKTAKHLIKRAVFCSPVIKNYAHSAILYRKFSRTGKVRGRAVFFLKYGSRFYLERYCKSKAQQIFKLLQKIEICPVDSSILFYSIDCMKTVGNVRDVFGNCTANYDTAVNGSFNSIIETLADKDSEFRKVEETVVAAFRNYLARCRQTPEIAEKYKRHLDAIESIFHRPAENFFEGLQRILFFNQFLWQTGHTLNGLGHLDWILENLYLHDLGTGVLTRESAAELLKDFFRILHENYWFKSNVLLGDTGQIIILGGRDRDGKYRCNDLTYLFIEVSKELRLPDPKVLLR